MNRLGPVPVRRFIWAGMQFVINRIGRRLEPGGISVRTTELNLTSYKDMLISGGALLYPRREIIELVARLAAHGRDVQPFTQAPNWHVLDCYLDAPRYTNHVYLNPYLSGYVSSSVGTVVHRGGT